MQKRRSSIRRRPTLDANSFISEDEDDPSFMSATSRNALTRDSSGGGGSGGTITLSSDGSSPRSILQAAHNPRNRRRSRSDHHVRIVSPPHASISPPPQRQPTPPLTPIRQQPTPPPQKRLTPPIRRFSPQSATTQPSLRSRIASGIQQGIAAFRARSPSPPMRRRSPSPRLSPPSGPYRIERYDSKGKLIDPNDPLHPPRRLSWSLSSAVTAERDMHAERRRYNKQPRLPESAFSPPSVFDVPVATSTPGEQRNSTLGTSRAQRQGMNVSGRNDEPSIVGCTLQLSIMVNGEQRQMTIDLPPDSFKFND